MDNRLEQAFIENIQMANMKRYLIPLVIREMKTKISMTCHYPIPRMAK